MKRETVKRILVYFLLILGALVMVFPFYWMVASSFKTNEEFFAYPPKMVPGNWLNFDNYARALEQSNLGRYFINSIIVTFSSVIITTVVTILGAFGFSRLRFPGRSVIFAILVAFMMVPFEMLVITNYMTVSKIGLIDTLPVLVIPFTTSIFYTYILKGFFDTLPDSLYYSARIDGASNWKYLWRVMVPIAKPSLVTIIL
ncbi:MAG: carbohydrate ABC transporter permease, partial [Lachnospiraceae bacterium]|nr:carbohydrate ABC transporter permease [Lachnospiraceae bacterium]